MNPNWITKSKVDQVMAGTGCTQKDATEYLESEGGNPAEAIESWKADRGLLPPKEKAKRQPRPKPATTAPAGKQDWAANLALFLTQKRGSALAKWHGKMTAAEQRALFGRFLGKGTIYIDGGEETLEHSITVGFGQDYDVTDLIKWRDL